MGACRANRENLVAITHQQDVLATGLDGVNAGGIEACERRNVVFSLRHHTPPSGRHGTRRIARAFVRRMKTQDASVLVGERQDRLLAGMAALVTPMQSRALAHDRDASFPAEDIAALRALGALAAPVPVALGGLGMGTEPAGALAIMSALRLLGRGNLSVGRLYEAHVNAIKLVARYGSDAQTRAVADDALAGHLFGLWVTDAPNTDLRVEGDLLMGAKAPCSGAGYATRALVTADCAGGTVLLVVSLKPGERADLTGWDLHGMRASATGRMTLDGIPAGEPVGQPGDYLRQPEFSAGAWRGSAVALGGLEALVGALRDGLAARQREGNPHQLARVGQALIEQETARLWVRRAALLAEGIGADDLDVANTVNLARIAVEMACLSAIQIVQRALGLVAFRRGSLTELLFRDLGFYLRQPAPDETLTEAAAHFMRHDLPDLT